MEDERIDEIRKEILNEIKEEIEHENNRHHEALTNIRRAENDADAMNALIALMMRGYELDAMHMTFLKTHIKIDIDNIDKEVKAISDMFKMYEIHRENTFYNTLGLVEVSLYMTINKSKFIVEINSPCIQETKEVIRKERVYVCPWNGNAEE